jgi:hypothetical protein
LKIPKQFKMLGHTIRVEVIKKSEWPYPDCIGIFIPDENKIQVLKQQPAQTLHAYFHEITHCALFMMNHKLYANEQFVDQLGGLLAQLAATAE